LPPSPQGTDHLAGRDAVDQADYFHLEFEAQEVILAEGAPAESYVECDNRASTMHMSFAALYPDDTRASFSYCLPQLEAGMAELAVPSTAAVTTAPKMARCHIDCRIFSP